jgi:hypothetical protein
MKSFNRWIASMIFMALATLQFQNAAAGFGWGCGTSCMANMSSYCPVCNYSRTGGGMMPWGAPQPNWWSTGPYSYSNFYAPAPWSYGPPGVAGGFYPGGGSYFAAKPNLYLNGPVGTEVSVKVKLAEAGSNWDGKSPWPNATRFAPAENSTATSIRTTASTALPFRTRPAFAPTSHRSSASWPSSSSRPNSTRARSGISSSIGPLSFRRARASAFIPRTNAS